MDCPNLDFEYGDADGHAAELAELYSYTEGAEFALNRKCFEEDFQVQEPFKLSRSLLSCSQGPAVVRAGPDPAEDLRDEAPGRAGGGQQGPKAESRSGRSLFGTRLSDPQRRTVWAPPVYDGDQILQRAFSAFPHEESPASTLEGPCGV
ncbi:hypothetical protein L345_14751, partial [Ophiophagus hannah]